jgi:hypothetical protein
MNITNCLISKNAGYEAGALGWRNFHRAALTQKVYLSAGSLTLTNCSITGNTATHAAAGYILNFSRPVIFNNCYIGNNYAIGGNGVMTNGGGLNIQGNDTFNYCIFANDVAAQGKGGAIFNNPNSTNYTTTLNHCTISGCKATCGGAIYNDTGNLDVFNSTISGNSATTGNGGGIYNRASLLLLTSTLAGNSAMGKGGGIYENGILTDLGADTIAFNQAASGGGAYGKSGNAYLQNTIVARNTLSGTTTPSDIAGTLATGNCSYDLIGTGGTGGITASPNHNQINVSNPGLAALASNGGATQTIMLQLGSPAINMGSNTIAGNIAAKITGPATDERNLTRIVGGTVDIGAVEVQQAGTPTHFVIQQSPQVSAGVPFALGVTVEDDSGAVVTGFRGTVTFTSTDTMGTLPGPYPFTATDAGVHTFSATLNTLGVQFITLTDTADNLLGISRTNVITPPARGTAFIDGNNQLFVLSNGQFSNTGRSARTFSAGLDAQGNPEVWFLDSMNQLWRWDSGVFTNTGGFAQKIAAGNGLVAFTDAANELWIFSDPGGFKNTGGFAPSFTAGFGALGNNQIVFADGMNQLWTYDASTGSFSNTGFSAKQFVAGQDAFGNSEIWFTDANNQIWRLDQGQATKTNGFALNNTAGGSGQMFFTDGINQIYQLTDSGVFTNTGGFASHLSGIPGSMALFFTDGMNRLWEFANGNFSNTGMFASSFSAF